MSVFTNRIQDEVSFEQLLRILKGVVSNSEKSGAPARAIVSHIPGIHPISYRCILDDVFFDKTRQKDMAVVFRQTGAAHFEEDYDLCVTQISDFSSISIDPAPDREFSTLESRYADLADIASRFLSMSEKVLPVGLPKPEGA